MNTTAKPVAAPMALPATPSFRLDGRRAIVTGAGRGIGLAAAVALADAGAEVTLAARTRPELEALAEAIRARGGRAGTMVLDVTDSAAVARAFAESAPFGILVNNAGTNRPRLMTDTSDEDLDAIVDLNVKAAYRVAREWARALLPTGRPGSLINVSSQMGHVGGMKRTVYCASKHAIEGFTKALAWELGPAGIRVNSLCPTFIETEMTRPMFADPAFVEYAAPRIALGRFGKLEDVMGAVVFLASDASAMVTGSALMVDGGWTAA
ncbi:SDR family oxidoreductase [Burkholderiaceae bacterium FT117]|uniref:SDR family NAD(P)-dependent oxidoreductase n=1 Tax=Zeimonas sediminis TaxID=2944268 RepID=UPI002342C402|nr:SDR family oxidoreductase [Zeimonas sediminis]MCM5570234.1 SDR family oxidoreductase [Zeimonas sediminis]